MPYPSVPWRRRLSAPLRIVYGILLGAAVLSWAQTRVAAVTEVVTDGDIKRALAIANGPEPARVRFHAPYVISLNDPTLERLEVITEIRRFVLASEEQLRLGHWMVARGGYDQQGRTLKEILEPASARVSLRARVRFHPLNTYIHLPAIDVLLGEPTLLALDVARTPILAPASNDPKSRAVYLGAEIETAFNALSIGDRVLPVRVMSETQELGRVDVDFSRLE